MRSTEQICEFFGGLKKLVHGEQVMSHDSQLTPKELLCALFLLAQEVPRLTVDDLVRATSADLWTISRGLEHLRREGLVGETGPRLTFLGLMAATQLVPASAWSRDDLLLRAAS